MIRVVFLQLFPKICLKKWFMGSIVNALKADYMEDKIRNASDCNEIIFAVTKSHQL